MKVTCTLKLQFETQKKAKNVFNSIHTDDASFMNTNINNNVMETIIETRSLSSMLHTIDDFLSCIQIAENIIKE